VVSRVAVGRIELIPFVFNLKAISIKSLFSRPWSVRCSNLNRLGIANEMREATAFMHENRGTFLPPEPFRAGKVFPVKLCSLTSDPAAPRKGVGAKFPIDFFGRTCNNAPA
jgi:hypothetical protein